MLSRHTWKVADKTAMIEFLDLIAKLDEHRLRGKECLGYLVKLATRNALRIEEQVTAERKRNWKTFVAGSAGGCAKGGYLYAKGPTGSQSSPLIDDNEEPVDEYRGRYQAEVDASTEGGITRFP